MDKVLSVLKEIGITYAYDHFAEGEVPDTPFICYRIPDSDNFAADGKVYYKVNKVYIEVYTDTKDLEVENKVDSVKEVSNAFIDTIFTELGLKAVNKETAIKDLAIFVEKFISINGNNENIFKEDRPAYLIKVGADDAQELTKIDTSSSKKKPLQCTEAFFDSKKSVLNSKACNKVHLCFKRTEPKYFGKNPICVQFATKKNYGTFKTAQYAEEADINNVIQTIFRNY